MWRTIALVFLLNVIVSAAVSYGTFRAMEAGAPKDIEVDVMMLKSVAGKLLREASELEFKVVRLTSRVDDLEKR